MLIEFTTSNFRSFRDPVCLSMEATKLKAEDPEVDTLNLAMADELKLLKVAGIYGANASGKSNLILAMRRMRMLVLDSSRQGQAGDSLRATPFRLATSTRGEPSVFECIWVSTGTQYRYGFKFTDTEITREWLHRRPQGSSHEHRLFLREGSKYRFHTDFSEGKLLRKQTRRNALHISVCGQFDGPISTGVIAWFRDFNVLHGLHSIPFILRDTMNLVAGRTEGGGITELVRRLDTDISDIKIGPDRSSEGDHSAMSQLPGTNRDAGDRGLALKTIHAVRDSDGVPVGTTEFDLDEESDGTQKLIALAGPWLNTLRRGGVIVIDEFDARLHPFISRELVRLFQSKDTNPRDAQLIFATHDTSLLDRCLLRRDQYWFIEKNRRYGQSELYSLAEVKRADSRGQGVRNDARFEREYLQGRYGAVPSVGGVHAAVARSVAAKAVEESTSRERS